MKKLVTMAALGAMAVGTAGAMTTEEIRLACEKNSSSVWVEKNSVCVQKIPCGTSNDKYCNREFQRIQVPTATAARDLVLLYLDKKMGLQSSEFVYTGGEVAGVKDNYIGVKTPDGGYIAFKFDDTTETFDGTASEGIMRAVVEKVYGYQLEMRPLVIRDVPDQATCEEVVDTYNKIAQKSDDRSIGFNGIYFRIREFDETTKTCSLMHITK